MDLSHDVIQVLSYIIVICNQDYLFQERREDLCAINFYVLTFILHFIFYTSDPVCEIAWDPDPREIVWNLGPRPCCTMGLPRVPLVPLDSPKSHHTASPRVKSPPTCESLASYAAPPTLTCLTHSLLVTSLWSWH